MQHMKYTSDDTQKKEMYKRVIWRAVMYIKSIVLYDHWQQQDVM